MDAGVITGLVGGAGALVLFVISCLRKARVDYSDAAWAGLVMMGSYNLWPPIYLFIFANTPALRMKLPAELLGYEKYIAVAAVFSFLGTVASIASFYAKAWARE